MQLLFYEALVEDERQRSQETLVNKNISLEGYEIRLEIEDVTCLPCHPIARTGYRPRLVTVLWLLAADILACYEEFVACGKHRLEGMQQRERTATGTDCRGATFGQP